MCCTLCTPTRSRNGGRISHTSRVIAHFVLKCSNFRCHGNRVGLAQILLAQLNSPTPITPTRSRNGGRISHTSRVVANFLLKFSNFRCHGNRVGLAQILLARLNSPSPITPYYVQKLGLYLPYKPSYCQFCVNIFKFSLPWQQGLVWHKSH